MNGSPALQCSNHSPRFGAICKLTDGVLCTLNVFVMLLAMWTKLHQSSRGRSVSAN